MLLDSVLGQGRMTRSIGGSHDYLTATIDLYGPSFVLQQTGSEICLPAQIEYHFQKWYNNLQHVSPQGFSLCVTFELLRFCFSFE